MVKATLGVHYKSPASVVVVFGLAANSDTPYEAMKRYELVDSTDRVGFRAWEFCPP